MTISIVTDSTCDLPASILTQYNITVVPVYINIGEQSYMDGVEISREEFYSNLANYPQHPTTSAPGTGTFIQTYQRLASEGASEILSIHISSNLSNVANVASLSVDAVKDIPVTVLDSGNLTLGTGLLVAAAARAIQEGAASVKEVLPLLKDQIKRTHCFALISTLQFLRRSGRLSNFRFGMGTLLDIKPILTMNNGIPKMESARTFRKGLEKLFSLVEKLGPLEQLSIVHTHNLEKAQEMYQTARHLFPANAERLEAEVTPVIGSHIGPGALGFVAIQR